jgi:type I restriction enzyme, S subunit
MIDELKAYPAYQESDHEWLGPVPEQWDILRAKYLFREVDERSTTGKEELLSVSHLTGVTPRSQKIITMFLAKSNIGHKVCRPDDLVINTMWAWMGALGVTRHTGIVSPAYGVYRPVTNARIYSGYADLLLRNPVYSAEYWRRSTGVNSSRLRLYPEHFLRVPLVVPPFDEQLAIVRFLDCINGRLERAIRAKRKVIALLNEQKQAIIHRAVTRGLDPSVPLKPSGIPWLAEVPQHWEVLALKRVLHRLIDCEHKTAPVADDSDLRVVRTTAIKRGKLFMRGTYGTSPEAFSLWTRRGVPTCGDVLFTREAPAGECCVMPEGLKACLGQRTVLMKLRPERLDPDFLVHSIYNGPARIAIVYANQGSTVGHFNMSDIGSLPIFLPPLEEQEIVVEKITRETYPLDMTIERLEREIELLREYRTRLFADVVTGKLDVREATAALPDEPAPDASEVDDDLMIDPDTAEEEVV